MEKNRPLRWLIFLTALIGFGYFQSGGGWNQNARFAMVRAVVERGELYIDSYLIYARAKGDSSTELRRLRTANGEYEIDGERRLLMWPSRSGRFCPVNGTLEGVIGASHPPTGAIQVEDAQKTAIPIALSPTTKIEREPGASSASELTDGASIQVRCGLDESGKLEAKVIRLLNSIPRLPVFKDLGPLAATGDVSFCDGHFYPNKAPGASFTALPAYWLIFHVEQIVGANPDDWWALTINAWLTSLLSVGIISAVGAVIFFQLALEFSGGQYQTSLIATFVFTLSTMFFPNATLFYEHNVIAVALLGSFYLLYRLKTESLASPDATCLARKAAARIFLAGLSAGWAAITNYIYAVVVIFLGAYLVFSVRRKFAWFWFGLGLIGPLLLICGYNVACFGKPFITNYHYQNPIFESGATHFLGLFNFPRWHVILIILFSPYRGLFFTAPVLIMSALGALAWCGHRRFRPEAILILGIFIFSVLWNASFNGWDGGVTAVPRYLGPAIPFLALATIYSIDRWFKTTLLLALVSAVIMLLITSVDPQPPVATGAATVLDKPLWQYNPLFEYELSVFVTRKPMPLLRQQEAQVLHYYEVELARKGWTDSERKQELSRIRAEIDRKITAGEPAPLLLARAQNGLDEEYVVADSELTVPIGPISAHTYGYYGNWTDGDFGAAGSRETRWNAFNLGEALFPESRWSLLPLLGILACAGWGISVVSRFT